MRHYLLTFCLLCSVALSAVDIHLMPPMQPVRLEVYHTLFFDQKGLLWLGTDCGLKSYDGYTMQNYRSDAYSPGLLPNNRVQCIVEDRQQHLWVGTNDGLACMDQRTRRFKTYRLPGQNQRIIYMLYVDSQGALWVGTDGGLSVYRPKTDDFYTYTTDNTVVTDANGHQVRLKGLSPKSMTEDKNGNLYIGTWDSGLLRMKRGSNKLVQYPQTNDRNSAFALYMDSRGRLWIGTWGHGIERLDRPGDVKNPGVSHWNDNNGAPFSIYYNIIEDPVSHTIWAVTREGVSILDLGDEAKGFTDLTDVAGQHLSQCTNIYDDDFGNIWISTWNDGVIHLNTTPRLFTYHDIGLPSTVRSVFTTDGTNFWLGLLPNGIASYNIQTHTLRTVAEQPAFMASAPQFNQATVPTVTPRPDGSLWLGSSSYGICALHRDGSVSSLLYDNAPFFHENYVTALYTTRNGCTLVGTRHGLGVAYGERQGARLTMKDGQAVFSECDVRGMAEGLGSVWVATDNEGIIRITGDLRHPASLRYRQYSPKDGRLSVDNAVNVLEDSHHRLWAISQSGGLFRYDKKDDRFLPVNRDYHIKGHRAFAIAEDAKGSLWLTTEEGIVRLTFQKDGKPTMTSFVEEDGLGDFLFSTNALFLHGRTMYAGTRGGFLSFTPDAIHQVKPQTREQLVVTNILIEGKPLAELDSTLAWRITRQAPTYTREITVPSSVEKLAIEFSLLNYGSQNRYAYWLEGYNDEWVYLDDNIHQAWFENMPAGTYHLHLKAADNYGNWIEMPYTVKVRILPPWWATWWACLLYLLLLAAAVWYGTWWYKNYLKTKNRLQMTKVFTNITHELLTPLAVLSASIEELRGNAPQYEQNYNVMQGNITRLTRLLRQILEVRKAQAGQLKLKVSQGNLTDFTIKELENLRPMATGKRQKLVTQVTDELSDVWFDTDKVDKIIYNLVSNAAKYNKEDGHITVTLKRDGDHAVLTVADEGIGISKDKLSHLYTRFLDGDYRRMNTFGTGIGLSLTHDLVKLCHGRIDCQSEVDKGTTFTVALPIQREAFADEEIDQACEQLPARQTILDAPTEETDDLVGEGNATSEYTLLVVEDNVELLQLMQRLLSHDFHVLTARNGQQAWNIVQRKELDMVISDVMMPVMDGIQLTRQIKESEDYAQLPVILLTAKTREEDRTEAYEVGADAYIIKPFRLEDVMVRVRSIIRNRERIRERFRSQTDFKVEDQHYSSPDELFVQRAYDCVLKHLDEYDREAFASDMNVSSSTLYKKLRAITGQNINSFIMSVRLKEACRILRREPDIRVGELSLRLGIGTPKYFSKCFKEEFGMSPKEYVEKISEEAL